MCAVIIIQDKSVVRSWGVMTLSATPWAVTVPRQCLSLITAVIAQTTLTDRHCQLRAMSSSRLSGAQTAHLLQKAKDSCSPIPFAARGNYGRYKLGKGSHSLNRGGCNTWRGGQGWSLVCPLPPHLVKVFASPPPPHLDCGVDILPLAKGLWQRSQS